MVWLQLSILVLLVALLSLALYALWCVKRNAGDWFATIFASNADKWFDRKSEEWLEELPSLVCMECGNIGFRIDDFEVRHCQCEFGREARMALPGKEKRHAGYESAACSAQAASQPT